MEIKHTRYDMTNPFAPLQQGWGGGSIMQRPQPTTIPRPRRIVRYIPWQWRLVVAGIRLTRMLRRSARKRLRQTIKQSRRFLLRVLPRHRPMRGARAR